MDRVYRALFVYTLGFHEVIDKATTSLGKNLGIVADIWKAYVSLLEHSCEHRHKLFVGERKTGGKRSGQRTQEEGGTNGGRLCGNAGKKETSGDTIGVRCGGEGKAS